jgi:hypothetical protein
MVAAKSRRSSTCGRTGTLPAARAASRASAAASVFQSVTSSPARFDFGPWRTLITSISMPAPSSILCRMVPASIAADVSKGSAFGLSRGWRYQACSGDCRVTIFAMLLDKLGAAHGSA